MTHHMTHTSVNILIASSPQAVAIAPELDLHNNEAEIDKHLD